MKTNYLYITIAILIGFCLVVAFILTRAYVREPISDDIVAKQLDGYVQSMSGWKSFVYSITSMKRASNSDISEANDVWCVVIKPPVTPKIGIGETVRHIDHLVLVLKPDNWWVSFSLEATEQDLKQWKKLGCTN